MKTGASAFRRMTEVLGDLGGGQADCKAQREQFAVRG